MVRRLNNGPVVEPPTAVIVDDEAELRGYLKRLLAALWPELSICAEAADGAQALKLIHDHRPQIAFLDIRMPGLSGLEVAARLTPKRPCHIVFVTAYDTYAVDAFEQRAVDYLLKPITEERLRQTVDCLKEKLAAAAPPTELAALVADLLAKRAAERSAPYLEWLRVQRGDGVELVPVADIIYFQSQDKYTGAVSRTRTHLLRTTIRALCAQLDPDRFWQVHRSTIVQVAQIANVDRSLTGRGLIRLKERPETLTVSRPYLQRFRQM
ncbi:MAG: LytTR family DNA-binding domain-containing protein [Desulfosarcinaceae bacterium]|nr:LytTR family DNA-binding domain-containing protein [Desulfosarcinaceae bacterium]